MCNTHANIIGSQKICVLTISAGHHTITLRTMGTAASTSSRRSATSRTWPLSRAACTVISSRTRACRSWRRWRAARPTLPGSTSSRRPRTARASTARAAWRAATRAASCGWRGRTPRGGRCDFLSFRGTASAGHRHAASLISMSTTGDRSRATGSLLPSRNLSLTIKCLKLRALHV